MSFIPEPVRFTCGECGRVYIMGAARDACTHAHAPPMPDWSKPRGSEAMSRELDKWEDEDGAVGFLVKEDSMDLGDEEA